MKQLIPETGAPLLKSKITHAGWLSFFLNERKIITGSLKTDNQKPGIYVTYEIGIN